MSVIECTTYCNYKTLYSDSHKHCNWNYSFNVDWVYMRWILVSLVWKKVFPVGLIMCNCPCLKTEDWTTWGFYSYCHWFSSIFLVWQKTIEYFPFILDACAKMLILTFFSLSAAWIFYIYLHSIFNVLYTIWMRYYPLLLRHHIIWWLLLKEKILFAFIFLTRHDE